MEFAPVPEEAPGHPTPVSLGTSIIACAFAGGVLMAADTRTTMGKFISHRGTNKLAQVGERIFCCRSGSAADTQTIAQLVAHYLDQHSIERGKLPWVKTAARLFQHLCYNNRSHISAGIIVGGWDPAHGGRVYSIPLGGACIEVPYAVAGSGSTYVMAWCQDHYKPNMTKEEALAFCQGAIANAISRDHSSGGMIRAVTITEAGVDNVTIESPNLPYELCLDPKQAALTNPTASVTVKA